MATDLAWTFKRGGKALPLAGFFLFVVGVLFGARVLQLGTLFQFQNLAGFLTLLVCGLLMMILFNTVHVDPEKKVVNIHSGFRFRPKHKVHQWDEFDSLVAHESWSSGSGSCYSLYLRDGDTQERSLLVQQYNHCDEMHDVARKLSRLMGIPALKSNGDVETPLVLSLDVPDSD